MTGHEEKEKKATDRYFLCSFLRFYFYEQKPHAEPRARPLYIQRGRESQFLINGRGKAQF